MQWLDRFKQGDTVPTADTLESKAKGVRAAVAEAEAQLEEVETSITLGNANNAPELQQAKRRRQAAELGGRIAELGKSLIAIARAQQEAEELERNQRQAKDWEEAEVAATTLARVAYHVQITLDQLLDLVDLLRKAELAWAETLPERPHGFQLGHLGLVVGRLVALRAYAKSDGRVRFDLALGIDSPHQLKTSGAVDIERRAREFIAVAMRARPKLYQPPPPSAA